MINDTALVVLEGLFGFVTDEGNMEMVLRCELVELEIEDVDDFGAAGVVEAALEAAARVAVDAVGVAAQAAS